MKKTQSKQLLVEQVLLERRLNKMISSTGGNQILLNEGFKDILNKIKEKAKATPEMIQKHLLEKFPVFFQEISDSKKALGIYWNKIANKESVTPAESKRADKQMKDLGLGIVWRSVLFAAPGIIATAMAGPWAGFIASKFGADAVSKVEGWIGKKTKETGEQAGMDFEKTFTDDRDGDGKHDVTGKKIPHKNPIISDKCTLTLGPEGHVLADPKDKDCPNYEKSQHEKDVEAFDKKLAAENFKRRLAESIAKEITSRKERNK